MSRESKNTLLSSDYDSTIALLDVYLTELNYRKQSFWNQIFKFFYAILLVILLPNIADSLHLNLPDFPTIIFRIIGLFLTFAFFYVSFGYSKRLEAISNTYQSLINTLPKKFRRQSINKLKNGKFYSLKIRYFVSAILFFSLLSISITLAGIDILHMAA